MSKLLFSLYFFYKKN